MWLFVLYRTVFRDDGNICKYVSKYRALWFRATLHCCLLHISPAPCPGFCYRRRHVVQQLQKNRKTLTMLFCPAPWVPSKMPETEQGVWEYMTSQQWCNPRTPVTFQMPWGEHLSILVTTCECRKPTFFLETLLGYAFTNFPFFTSSICSKCALLHVRHCTRHYKWMNGWERENGKEGGRKTDNALSPLSGNWQPTAVVYNRPIQHSVTSPHFLVQYT